MNKKKPRKVEVIKRSKYDASGALNIYKQYWNKILDEMEQSMKAPTKENESRCLSEALPSDLYEKVCDTLDIPLIKHVDEEINPVKEQKRRRLVKEPLITFRTSLYIDREADSDTEVECSESEDEAPNFYREFLNKPEREQITWNTHYLLPERDDEKGLVKKADDLTDAIANKFCEFMTQLGGKQQSQLFTPKAVKELFQIEFDYHVARGLRVVPQLLPAVPERIANATGNPDKSYEAMLDREILRDIRAESRPDRVRAFGTSFSRGDQWRAPRNNTKQMWRSARRVLHDLVTLKTVWEGITNLKSVREYCRWIMGHPQHRRAPYLSSLGLFDRAVLDARRTLDLSPGVLARSDAGVDNIKRRLSQLADV